MNKNMVGWFEIPVSNMTRAKKFYEKVFDINIKVEFFGDTQMGWFPLPEEKNAEGAAGSLVYNKQYYKPMPNGTLVYFSTPEITIELNNVEGVGGVILQEKTLIREDIGYMALFLDSEGNRIALHSRE